jgi:dipeptidyl aminopeptidase/acylaminoacyl peptidase
LPEIDSGDAENLWRSVWVYDLQSNQVRSVPLERLNVWESAWLNNEDIVAVVSDSHSEGSWYSAKLLRIGIGGSKQQVLLVPTEQIGMPCANPAGTHVAIVEAVCSDRMIVAGDLRLIDIRSDSINEVDTHDVDVTHLAWRNDRVLVITGHRGFETVTGELNLESGNFEETWADAYRTMGAWYPSLTLIPGGGCAAFLESYEQAPELTIIGAGQERVILSQANPEMATNASPGCHAEHFTWSARDGLEIQGWLIRPENQQRAAPLVVDIHGGPVWACRNRWMGRLRGAKALADRGFVLFYPNPRGSSCRGQEFASRVRGDMGGEDTYDFLTGIDALVEQGIADPERIGVTGISYGGFMSCWLITQDERFAAAVPISPVTNWYSQHGTSQIPFFDELFLDGNAREANGKFFQRSPVMFADGVKCPTLILTGAVDQNTPPTQALEFHRGLLENGVKSVLATYPTAGHGIRSFPEVIDHTTRYVGWFLEHLQ